MHRTRIKISRGGQISIPATVRRRWGVDELLVEDAGDRVVLRPMPRDPVMAARGALAPFPLATDRLRVEMREEAAEVENGPARE